jgi:hypothetical protein
MSDFNQPTRRQNAQTPSSTRAAGQQTRQTEHGSIERNPDASPERVGAESVAERSADADANTDSLPTPPGEHS